MSGAILVVDTDAYSRRLTEELRERGCTVAEAASFGEALDVVRRAKPARAIVELSVGGGSALDFLALLRGMDFPPRVLVVTAFAQIGSAVKAMRLGAAGYLCKPLRADAVLDAFDGQQGSPPPLEVAIGMHLEYSLSASGSVAGAARRLGLDRRSLRRMLARYPTR